MDAPVLSLEAAVDFAADRRHVPGFLTTVVKWVADHPFPNVPKNPRIESILEHVQPLTLDEQIETLNEAKRRHWFYASKVGTLTNNPDVTWEAIISVEGDLAKRTYMPYLRQRSTSGDFTIKAEERFGRDSRTRRVLHQ